MTKPYRLYRATFHEGQWRTCSGRNTPYPTTWSFDDGVYATKEEAEKAAKEKQESKTNV